MSAALIFVHGSGDSRRIWREQTAYFSGAQAIDLPGHGQRADTLPTSASVADYARSVHDCISNELRIERPIIAGHSLGGAIALQMGLDEDKRPGGLILIGTGARLRVHPALLEEAERAPEQAKIHLTELGTTEEHFSKIGRAVLEEREQESLFRLHRDLAACDRFDVMSRLADIDLPVLIICGAQDRLTPVKYSEYLHQHIAHSRLVVVERAGHYVMREQPGAVNEAIERWLSEG
ncbi:MAG: alpha/beta hydrolase [Ktedonobacteraceae bacterium]|nr:alpha/beta hydrolase [Ktedonobacteraceae bacterium]